MSFLQEDLPVLSVQLYFSPLFISLWNSLHSVIISIKTYLPSVFSLRKCFIRSRRSHLSSFPLHACLNTNVCSDLPLYPPYSNAYPFMSEHLHTETDTHLHRLCTHTGWMKEEMAEDSGNIKLYVKNDGGLHPWGIIVHQLQYKTAVCWVMFNQDLVSKEFTVFMGREKIDASVVTWKALKPTERMSLQ